MAKVPNNIINSVLDFIKEADKDNIRIQRAILFGSYANGNYKEYSDIDLAVVSEDFEGNSFYDYKKLVKAILNSNIDIEPHTYRPEEFTEEDPFVNEILSYGIRIL